MNSSCWALVPSTVEYRAISSKTEVMTVMPSPGRISRRLLGVQPGVAVVHHLLQPLEGDDGVGQVGADELVGDLVPHAELDLLAVEQHQAGAGGQGGVRGEGVHQPGLAAAGLPGGEQVLVDDLDVHLGAELVDADEHRVEHGHGQHRPWRQGAARCGQASHGLSPKGGCADGRAGARKGSERAPATIRG